jgi:predicted transcriptional regulator
MAELPFYRPEAGIATGVCGLSIVWNGSPLDTPVIPGGLRHVDAWHTMYDVKNSAVTIRLEPELQKLLDKVCKQGGRTRSDILREALRRQLSIIRFEQLRRQVLPFAEARGYLADEDVSKAVS